MAPKKPTTTPAGEASHQKGLRRLGSIMHSVSAGATPLDTGKALNEAMEAGVKAILPGRQSDKQIQDNMVKFRQAFVRQLAAEVVSGAASDSRTV